MLDKLTYAGNLANLAAGRGPPRFTFVRGDICDAGAGRAVLPGHDMVINFAAETHVDRSIAGAADFVAANVAGVQVLLQACLDAGTGGSCRSRPTRCTAASPAARGRRTSPLAPTPRTRRPRPAAT